MKYFIDKMDLGDIDPQCRRSWHWKLSTSTFCLWRLWNFSWKYHSLHAFFIMPRATLYTVWMSSFTLTPRRDMQAITAIYIRAGTYNILFLIYEEVSNNLLHKLLFTDIERTMYRPCHGEISTEEDWQTIDTTALPTLATWDGHIQQHYLLLVCPPPNIRRPTRYSGVLWWPWLQPVPISLVL